MKTARTMIREYELANPPGKKSVRMYTYVRPHKNGECTVEIHAAVNSTRKGEPLMTKRVFRMFTDNSRFEQRDLLWYSNWSMAAPPDHWVVDFHESGRGQNWLRRANMGDEHLLWNVNYASRCEWWSCNFPFAKMLNSFDGTKYKYCGYDPTSGLSVAQYLSLYAITPKVELISKAGLFNLLNPEALMAFDENPDFAKWLAKNAETAKRKWWNLKQCVYHFGREISSVRSEEMKRVMRERRVAAERRAQELRIRNRINKSRKDSKAIYALYEKIKNICGFFEAYEVYVPKNNADMVVEGERMHNCIGQMHVSSVAEGREICVFLRKNRKPYIDIAISAKTYKVIEIRRVCNAECSGDEKRVGDRIAEMVSAELKKVA